jgi:hypothetical protein
LVYENAEEEPELHARTYLALASMFLLNFVQVVALQGPPAVVCASICPQHSAFRAKFVISYRTLERALTVQHTKPGFPTHCHLYKLSSAR